MKLTIQQKLKYACSQTLNAVVGMVVGRNLFFFLVLLDWPICILAFLSCLFFYLWTLVKRS